MLSEAYEHFVTHSPLPTGYISEKPFPLINTITEGNSYNGYLPSRKTIFGLLSLAEFGGLIYIPFHLNGQAPTSTEAFIGLLLAAGLIATSIGYLVSE